MQSRDNDRSGGSTRSETNNPAEAYDAAVPTAHQRATLSSPASLGAPGDAPAVLGRYRLGSLLGEGGMGSVFEAYDQQLEREVAIKLIRPDRAGPAARRRLKHEAEVMARVPHPNVLTILDVGEDRGEVFVVLERVAGPSLAQWLDAPRAHGEIIEMFTAAAHGLAAAHEQGVVHGDFKPANVLIAGDGRVLVADFGLARAEGDAAQRRGRAGTPRYMAPEVRSGEAATQASDQFSFGIALLEALGGTLNTAGRPELPRATRRRDRGLERGLTRMLSKAPGQRFDSMSAVVAALRPARWRSRAAWLALPVVALGVAGLAGDEAPPPDPCEAPGISEVERDADTLVEAVRAKPLDDLESRGQTLMTRAELTACPSAVAHVGNAVGEAYARAAKLDEADAVLQRSFSVATEDGNDTGRARIAIQLATLHGVRRGDGDGAQRWLRHARAAAQAADDAELEAHVEQAYGAVALRSRDYARAETHLRRALEMAGANAAPDFRGGVRANLAAAVASQMRLDDALEELAAAAVALEDAPGQAAALVAVLTNRASILRQIGRVPEALENYSTALHHAQGLHGDRHPSVATLHVNLGQLALLDDDAERAHEHMNAAVAIRVAVLGKGDTQTARAQHGLGEAELALGRVDDAERSFVRAREVLEGTPEDTLSSYPEVGLAQVDLARGDVVSALRRLNRARPAIERAGPWFSRADTYRTLARAHLADRNVPQACAFEVAAIAAYGQAGPAYYERARAGDCGGSTASTAVSGSSR